VKVAKTAYDNDISNLHEVRESEVVFNSVKIRTSDREFREIRKRLETLTLDQINILIHGDLISQKQIAFLAVCKRYDFIRDFAIDIVRDKVLVYDYKINESDYNSFINNRVHIHPELEEFEDSTLKKAKQVLFHILEQADIISSVVEKTIRPQLIQSDVIRAIANDDSAWLKIFMMPDKDIKQLKY
jgi:hypothetical protein